MSPITVRRPDELDPRCSVIEVEKRWFKVPNALLDHLDQLERRVTVLEQELISLVNDFEKH